MLRPLDIHNKHFVQHDTEWWFTVTAECFAGLFLKPYLFYQRIRESVVFSCLFEIIIKFMIPANYFY